MLKVRMINLICPCCHQDHCRSCILLTDCAYNKQTHELHANLQPFNDVQHHNSTHTFARTAAAFNLNARLARPIASQIKATETYLA
jgi:hypothetical protein